MKLAFTLIIIFLVVFMVGCSSEKKIVDYGSSKIVSDTTKTNTVQENSQATSASTQYDVKEEKIMSVTVYIYEGKFQPKEVTIDKGGKVTWINRADSDQAINGPNFPVLFSQDYKSSGVLHPGEKWEKTFDEEGFYNYFNFNNEEITGKVVVR